MARTRQVAREKFSCTLDWHCSTLLASDGHDAGLQHDAAPECSQPPQGQHAGRLQLKPHFVGGFVKLEVEAVGADPPKL